ncbi:TetR/AcrR family transcriptional regulator [Rathayibacter sp. YIM 133350]|uniref:TetR/AcrR family transcriptional regulator n=1 Tax=Rathayibacter sp. YIM 133350 TaxID=3131992 RepID=UPI00307F9C7E
MALTSKGAATRQRIIEGAASHLRETEFEEMTLDDVLAATRTSKGQLFHYFPGGKDELLLAVMRSEANRVLADQQPHLDNLTTWAAWDSWRAALLERYRAQGTACPLNSLIGQLGRTPGAREVTRALLSQWQEHLATGIRSMQRSGSMSADRDADYLAAALLAGIQGGVIVMWSTGSTDHLASALDVLFDSMSSPERAAAVQAGLSC